MSIRFDGRVKLGVLAIRQHAAMNGAPVSVKSRASNAPTAATVSYSPFQTKWSTTI